MHGKRRLLTTDNPTTHHAPLLESLAIISSCSAFTFTRESYSQFSLCAQQAAAHTTPRQLCVRSQATRSAESVVPQHDQQ
eukprot:1716917-Pyramimonas_sp.AAC.3